MKLDKKDMHILQLLDKNSRISFAAMSKIVGLSKNSVRLRFERLKGLMTHITTGINNKALGYTLVKIFYSIDSLDNKIEESIIRVLKKTRNVIYVARHYGHYNLEVALFVKDFDELSLQMAEFDKTISKKSSDKEIGIITKEFFFENRFLYDNQRIAPRKVIEIEPLHKLSKQDKRILSILRKDARISILELSQKSHLDTKTVIRHVKDLEIKGIIVGYFMGLDHSEFSLNISKLLVQTNNRIEEDKFEKQVCMTKNVRHFSKMIGLWDYEIDMFYSTMRELQEKIEDLKKLLPDQIRKIEIISHGKRILTNQEMFLVE